LVVIGDHHLGPEAAQGGERVLVVLGVAHGLDQEGIASQGHRHQDALGDAPHAHEGGVHPDNPGPEATSPKPLAPALEVAPDRDKGDLRNLQRSQDLGHAAQGKT
jgi:hypothetical protein